MKALSKQLTELMERTAKLENKPIARGILTRFLTDAGSQEWEEEFGDLWDQYAEEAKDEDDEFGLPYED